MSEGETTAPVAQPKLELSAEDQAAILAVRTQRDAKEAAEKFLGKRVRPKQVRGYCCLFVGAADYTDYFGYNWQGAFMAMVFRTRLGAQSPESQKLVRSTTAEAPPIAHL